MRTGISFWRTAAAAGMALAGTALLNPFALVALAPAALEKAQPPVDPARYAALMEGLVRSPEDLADRYAAQAVEDYQRTLALSEPDEGPMMMLMGGPDELRIASLTLQTNGLLVGIACPEGFTNTVDVFTTSLLAEGVWDVAETGLVPDGTNTLLWLHPGSADFEAITAGDGQTDTDTDGLADAHELLVHGTAPENADSDGDGIPDGWEFLNGLDPLDPADAAGDADGDDLSNLREYQHGTDPFLGDTSGDGMLDGQATGLGLDPLGSHSLSSVPPSGVETSYRHRVAERHKFGQWESFIPTNPPVFYTRLVRTVESIHSSESASGERIYSLNLTVAPGDLSISGTAAGTGYWETPLWSWNLSLSAGWTGGQGTEVSAYTEDGHSVVTTNSFCGVGYMDALQEGQHGAYGEANFASWPSSATLEATLRRWQGSEEGDTWDFAYELHDEYTTEVLASLGGDDLASLGATHPWPDLEWGDEVRRISTGDPCSPLSTETNASWVYTHPARYLSANEVVHSLRDTSYRFSLGTASGEVYRLAWLEVFEPDAETNPGATNQVLAVRSVLFVGTGETVHIGNPGHDPASAYAALEGPGRDHDFVLQPPPPELGNGSVVVTILSARLVPDWNRDKKIDSSDENQATASNPFRFWKNDDDDQGADSGNDIPGSGWSDSGDSQVDGVRDLIDFFPLFLDLKDALDLLGTTDFTYALQYNLGGIGFVYTDLAPANAGDYLTNHTTAESLAELAVNVVTGFGNGKVLDTTFLTAIQNSGKGVILVEADFSGTDPLVLNIIDSSGIIACSVNLELSISGVEDMFRHVNLADNLDSSENQTVTVPDRFTGPGQDPTNLPDSLSNGSNFVFLHGYKVDQNEARGWNAEIFKRLHQAGSRAKFTGVTWHGNTGANYHRAVVNAMVTSENLASQLSFLSGEVTIGAHSLGNILVSEAIVNNGFTPDRYFMFNAAVAIEAYDANQVSGQGGVDMEDNMRHPDWSGYTNRLLASKWHELFPNDNRQDLGWGNRFSTIDSSTDVFNFYSEGEDVVQNADGSVPGLIGDAFLGNGRLAWALQEMIKGLDGPLGLYAYNLTMPDQHAGWQFNPAYDTSGILLGTQPPDPASASLLTDAELRTNPFFEPFIGAGQGQAGRFASYDGALLLAPLGDSEANTQAALKETQYKILAEAIPARSFAAASNEVNKFNPPVGPSRNIHMHGLQNGWPSSRPNTNWLHSDLKNIAFSYVYKFYNRVIQEGGLDAP